MGCTQTFQQNLPLRHLASPHHNLLTHFLVDVHSGYFQFSSITNSAVMDILTCVTAYAFENFSRSEFLDLVESVTALTGCVTLGKLLPFTSPTLTVLICKELWWSPCAV